jgi:hypothetical protein
VFVLVNLHIPLHNPFFQLVLSNVYVTLYIHIYIHTMFVCVLKAFIGIGSASGPNRARDAAMKAVSSPLLDIAIAQAKV